MENSIQKTKKEVKTNKVSDSLVRCEVSLESGAWISPGSCEVFKINENAKFPEIIFEIKDDFVGAYDWSWEMAWIVMACPQNRKKPRFNPKNKKTYVEKGRFTSKSKKWVADLDGKVLGGTLSVAVKVGTKTFLRKVIIKGVEPGEEKILQEIRLYEQKNPDETRVAKKILKQETNYHHFFSDEEPLVSFDNGYGLAQATNPVPSYEEVWNWKKHLNYIVIIVIAEKRALAKNYLARHGNYSEDDLDMETLVFYNGANHHYLVWDKAAKKWKRNEQILCDPQQSNTGWDMEQGGNVGKTLAELRKGLGEKPKYTGRCYAQHIKGET